MMQQLTLIPIRNEQVYGAALAAISPLLDEEHELGTPESDFIIDTALANMCGTPAMSVPSGFSEALNLPIGIQFFAGFGGESLLFKLAGQLERALPWQVRKPPV